MGVPWGSGGGRGPLTVGVLRGLDAHVGLALVHARLPLAALLLHGRLGAVLGVDVGQVGRGVVVGLQGVVVLDLNRGTPSNQCTPSDS
jgi:hypothetical protein